MITPPVNNTPIDLEFLPDWARTPSTAQTFPDRGPREDRHPRKERDRQPRGERRPERRPPPRDRKREPFRRNEAPPPPAAPLPVDVSFIPEPKALESVVDQVRASARAYPLFSIARMF